MTRGFFLVLEGPEGAGKSTLGAGLAARMRAAGAEPVVVREPGGTPAAERMRELLLDPAARVPANSELLYLAAARASLVNEIIRPALDAGRTVVSDRFDLSTMAYQVAGRGLDAEMVTQVNRCATGDLRADLTLVLDLAAELGRARQLAAGKTPDRIEREDSAFHERVAQAYRSADAPGIVHVDASRPAEQVLESAWGLLQQANPETFGRARG